MSQPLVATTGDIPIRINQSIVQRINTIATKQQTKAEILINKILEQYLANQHPAENQNGAAFLLSIAGMFHSGTRNTSENVRSIVADLVLRKHGEKS